MYNITLICTVHAELGKCTSNELYRFIDKIQPEIIFDEIPPSRYNAYFIEQTVTTLETDTIKMYLGYNNCKIIPVDSYEFSEIQKGDMDYNIISNNSIEYYNLCKEQFSMIIDHGFEYVNSTQNMELIERLQTIEKDVLKNTDDVKLFENFKLWYKITDNRENDMLKNIYDYSANHSYNNAVFFIGAEHKKSIMKKIQGYETKNGLKLNWNYNIYK
ncbi:MAG: hypothetical protein LBD07_06380 [Spirochaetaceae bacterium]|jgi:pheromone shutdown protein TraB|nr:hypothetical protein [Spirochaetaceae bacterium]